MIFSLILKPIKLFLIVDDNILWEILLKGDAGSNCFIGVDGTDFQVYCQKESYNFWHGFKFKNPGVRCGVGVSIFNGDSVWINGSLLCGHLNDIKKIQIALKNMPKNG